MALMNCQVQGLNYVSTAAQTAQYTLSSGTSNTLYHYWTHDYYPYVIKESYPVYLQEKAMDKGKQAFEIIKALIDQKLIKLDKVSDFVTAMDTILKTL